MTAEKEKYTFYKEGIWKSIKEISAEARSLKFVIAAFYTTGQFWGGR